MIRAEQRTAALLSSRTLLGAGLAYLFAMGLALDDLPASQPRSVRLKHRYAEQAVATFTYALLPRKE